MDHNGSKRREDEWREKFHRLFFPVFTKSLYVTSIDPKQAGQTAAIPAMAEMNLEYFFFFSAPCFPLMLAPRPSVGLSLGCTRLPPSSFPALDLMTELNSTICQSTLNYSPLHTPVQQ